MTDAVTRRLVDELGMSVTGLRCVLPDFRYQAVDADGIVENELCPVFVGTASHPKQPEAPNPDEVMEWRWVRWDDLVEAVRLTPFVFSPWAVLQVQALPGR
jgi:isopentenyl-diphosphate delta-isomerase